MRYKKEARGKPLSPEKGRSILEKLFAGIEGQKIAEEEDVSDSTVSKIKRQFPLFFDLAHGGERRDKTQAILRFKRRTEV